MMQQYIGLFFLLLIFACSPQKTSEKNQPQDMDTLHHDFHSFAKPTEALMTHLDLNIVVDFEKKIIKGRASVHYKLLSSTATKLFLDTKDLKIEKITFGKDEKPVPFNLGEEVKHLGKPLGIDLIRDSQGGIVHIYYETSPQAEALQWLNPQQTNGNKHPFLFTQSQAILARSWVPCQDSPGIRFTYNAKVQVPKDLLAVMSAENPQSKNDWGIYEFKMPQPIPAYLLALAVGDLSFEKIGKNTGVYAEPSMLKASVYEFADLQKMLEAAEKIYGVYAWGQYDLIVLPPSFPFGGMENPRLTFATPTILAGDRSLTSLVAHELAHSWSGNLVTNATWNDFWLNEGFTVYFERRIMEAIYGKDYAEMLMELGYTDLQETLKDMGKDNPDTHLKLDLKDRNPDDGVTDIAYEKGFFLLLTIEKAVGREKWDAFLKKYFQNNAFKTMDTERFLAYLKTELPETEKLNVEEWVYKPNLPENCPKIASKKFQKVGQMITAWNKTHEAPEKGNSEIKFEEWSSHETLYYLKGIMDSKPDKADMRALDNAFGFTKSGNSEILAQWLLLAIATDYEPAYPKMEEFLMRVGRRKFILPLYKALLKTEKGKKMAKEIYQKARPNYHFVAVNTLDGLVK